MLHGPQTARHMRIERNTPTRTSTWWRFLSVCLVGWALWQSPARAQEPADSPSSEAAPENEGDAPSDLDSPESERPDTAEPLSPEADANAPSENGGAEVAGSEVESQPPDDETAEAPQSPPSAHAASNDDAPDDDISEDEDASDRYPDEDHHENDESPHAVHYTLERVDIRGNTRTRDRVIRARIPFEDGDVIVPDDPDIQAIEWSLRGTGWFDRVELSLERGEERGSVILVVTVHERNTIVVTQLTLGVSEGLSNSADPSDELMFYGGATVADTNLFGSGATLALSALGAVRARGLRIDFQDGGLLGGRYSLRAAAFYTNAREYFGNDPLVSLTCPPDVPECVDEALNAVVFYRRGGLMLGTGRDFGASTRFTIDWQGEVVHVRSIPEAASERRGSAVVPINFSVQDGHSYVSLLRAGLTYDRRDDPGLPTRGIYLRVEGDLAHRALRSDYDFLKLQVLFRAWVPLRGHHSLRFGVYAGAIFGDAPFFYLFHVGDLTDFIPSRYLDMQLDRRRAPNLLNTAIDAMLQQELATRLDVQYELPLFRGTRGLRALNAYVNVGIIALANTRDLTVSIPGYDGFSQLPVDLTLDLGLRFDTRAGVFQLGFSNLLGFIDL